MTCGVVNASDDTADSISLVDEVYDADFSTDLISVENDEQKNNVVDSNLAASDESGLNNQAQNEILSNVRQPSGKTFDDIQKVIDDSKDNDIIKLSGTYFGSGKPLTFHDKALTFCGENNATLDARNLSEIFNFFLTDPVTVSNVKFINYRGTAILDGYVLNNKSTLTVDNCLFMGNHVARAIYVYNGDCLISNCRFVNNYDSNYGGAISGHGSVVNCEFINNSARVGGAINAIENVINCTFINNSATSWGGAIERAVSVSGCSFVNNFAKERAVINGAGSVSNCSFVNNTAYDYSVVSNARSVCDCSFVNNTVRSDGIVTRGVSIRRCSFINNDGCQVYESKSVENCSFIENNGRSIFNGESVTDCIFINNKNEYTILRGNSIMNCTFINSNAGAIYIDDGCNISDCRFINNTAAEGGAIQIIGNDWYVTDCSFINNTAAGKGGAIYIVGKEGHVSDCRFINNAAGEGGAIYVVSDDCRLDDCEFINNSADAGGAIHCSSLNVLVNNTLFCDNKLDAVHSMYEIFIENYTLVNQTKEDLNLIEVEPRINATFDVSYSDTYFRSKDITVRLTDSSGNPIVNQRILIELSNGTATRMTTDSDGCIVYKLSGFGLHNLTFSTRSNIYNVTKKQLNNVKIETYDYLTPNGTTTDDIQYVLDNAYDGDLIILQGKYTTGVTDKLKIQSSLIIEGGYSTEFDSKFSGFDIKAHNVTIKNIHSNIYQVAGYGYQNISLINCLFADNHNGAVKGCLNLTVINCSFVNNSAFDGGAISSCSGLKVYNCTFINNSAREGGAISACKGMKIYNSTFINNSASMFGGAIILNAYGGGLSGYTATYLFNCSFIGNSASKECGAFMNSWADDIWDVVNCRFIANSAGERYGAAYGGNFYGCLFKGNTAKYDAAIASYDKAVNCSFDDNRDIYYLKKVVKISSNKKEFPYNTVKTLDVKLTSTNPNYSVDGLIVAFGDSFDYWECFSNSRVNSDGTAHLKISSQKAGTYYVYAYLRTDSDSGFVVTSSKITIKKAKPTVSAPKVTAKYKKSKYFKVTVKLNKKAFKNLKVKVKVFTGKKYKTYTLKTDKKGIVKINTKKLKRGTHKVVISSGNSNYYISKTSSI
ncbi:right-handed parallel beta-helix repeat-containing protein, partial [Methanobrevibacter sp.]|uniref:right-handed parallel beta-helix repeat-containing protein n=1 Tax=Methanobrevibacter sp. TaxID=66852 RepID=UPI00388F1782